MASLENKKIKDTYQGLLKTDDNAAIDGAVEITDGAGNGTGVTISNDGQVTATGTVSFGSLKDTGENITITKFVDEADGIGNNDNDTSIPTSAAVKDYVDTNVTAQDLDFQGDSGTGAVDLDSQTLDIAGGTGIDTSASGQTLTVNIDSTVATLSDTQTLTNKTIDADNNTVSNLEVDNLKSGVLDTDLTSVSASDDTLASAKAIKTYVDSNITAQDLDITDGTTTSAVDLDSQTLTIQGTTNEVEVGLTGQTFTVGLPTSITTNLTGNADTASALQTARTISLSGDVAGSVSFDGSANADITATIQANSVALGTDTTGDYVSGLGTGTGVTIGSNTGEGSSPTISVDYGSTANTAVQGNTSLTIQGTANEIEVTGGGVTLGSGGTVTVGLPNDVSLGGSLTIAQNLTVNGTTTTVNTDTLSVEDPLIELARDNSENSVDVGLYGKYSLDSGVTTKYSGLFKDASDSDKFKLFKGLEVEPTSTVNTSGTGYTKGDLVINDLDAVTISGTISTAAQTNITSVGTLSSLTVSGDLTVDTNTLYVNSSNNRVGIGTASPSDNLEVNGAIRIADQYELKFGGTTASIFGSSSLNQLRFYTNNSERFRIDSSGNVGIGTSSPSSLLEVFDSNSIGLRFGDIASTPSSQTAGYIGMSTSAYSGNNGDLVLIPRTSSASNILLMEGNVGIGTTSPASKTHIDFTADFDGLRIQNSNRGHNYLMTTAGGSAEFFSLYDLDNTNNLALFGNDASVFYTTGTERMRIDSSGNVGIGTTSPTADLSVGSTSTSSGDVHLRTTKTTFSMTPSNTDAGGMFLDVGWASGGQGPFRFGIGGSEKMRIDPSGRVGIGVSSPNSILHLVGQGGSGWTLGARNTLHLQNANASSVNVSNAIVLGDQTDADRWFIMNDPNANGTTADVLTITNAGSERMRITSGGDLQVGTTSIGTTARIYTEGDAGTAFSFAANKGNSTAGAAAFNRTDDGAVCTFYRAWAGAGVGSISVTSTATAYNTSSDYRLKENVVDMTGALDRIDQLEPKRFNFIADKDTTVDGFLAHQVQDIVPEAVTGEKDATEEYEVNPEVLDDEGNVVEEAVMGTRDVYQGIDQSKLVPLLVGAIKELNAKVAALEAQINN